MDKNQEILKHFDNIFKTDTGKHINYEDMKLLKELYYYLEERVTTPSKRYNEIRHKRVEMSEYLRRTLTNEQRATFDKYNELGNEMQGEELEQVFMFGYIISKELDIECKIK